MATYNKYPESFAGGYEVNPSFECRESTALPLLNHLLRVGDQKLNIAGVGTLLDTPIKWPVEAVPRLELWTPAARRL